MTYHPDAQAAAAESPFTPISDCMCCGKPASGPTVSYDLTVEGGVVRALFHRDCAFAMAQRIICDAWPRRRDGELMRNDQ